MLGELSLVGPLSDDPAPDLLDVSPRGDYVFRLAARRAAAHGGPLRTGVLRAIAPIANVGAAGVDRADLHGSRVRLE